LDNREGTQTCQTCTLQATNKFTSRIDHHLRSHTSSEPPRILHPYSSFFLQESENKCGIVRFPIRNIDHLQADPQGKQANNPRPFSPLNRLKIC